jgi:hypothetical protein
MQTQMNISTHSSKEKIIAYYVTLHIQPKKGYIKYKEDQLF